MPIPAAVVAAGISALGSGTQAYAQGRMNRKTREWNEKMYTIQRADALHDWQMINNYNSPESQMQRYRAAGLNPNLIYGQSQDAPAVRSSDTGHWNPQAPQYSDIATGAVSAYQNTQALTANLDVKQAQSDNLQAMHDQIEANIIKTFADITGKGISNARNSFDLELQRELRQNTLDLADTKLNKMRIDSQVKLDANDRAAASTEATIAKAAEAILRSQAERQNIPWKRDLIMAQIGKLRADKNLQEYYLQLQKMGVSPNSSLGARILGETLQNVRNKFSSFTDKINSGDINLWNPAKSPFDSSNRKAFMDRWMR